jgi:transposase
VVTGLLSAELPVVCVETRHMKAVLKAQQVNKSDRNDARGIAQMMRVGLYKPVHVKTLASQQDRTLLTSRKLLRDKLQDMENELRAVLCNFGRRVGAVSSGHFEARVREVAPVWDQGRNWGARGSVLLDGADDEKKKMEDRRGAEGEDRAGGAARAVDGGRPVAALRDAGSAGMLRPSGSARSRSWTPRSGS